MMDSSTSLNSSSEACSLHPIDQQAYLRLFIHQILSDTQSIRYSGEAAMQLLDQVWKAQKLLWQLRNQ
jgi:hypothetical protein